MNNKTTTMQILQASISVGSVQQCYAFVFFSRPCQGGNVRGAPLPLTCLLYWQGQRGHSPNRDGGEKERRSLKRSSRVTMLHLCNGEGREATDVLLGNSGRRKPCCQGKHQWPRSIPARRMMGGHCRFAWQRIGEVVWLPREAIVARLHPCKGGKRVATAASLSNRGGR